MKTILFSLIVIVALSLSACGSTNQPLTDAEKAAQKGMTLEEYKEMKEAAARMNMNMEDHMKMIEE